MGWRNRAAALVGVVGLLAGIGLPLIATEARALGAPSSESPGQNAVVKPPATVSATYQAPLSSGSITLQKLTGGGAGPVSGHSSVGTTINSNSITFTPDAALGDGQYQATANANSAIPNDPPSHFIWNFTVDGTKPAPPAVNPVGTITGSNKSAVHVTGTAEPS